MNDELMRGTKWTAEELEKLESYRLNYGGTMTGRMMGGPAVINQISKKPPIIALDPIDIELLNPLHHPTKYQRTADRNIARDRLVYHAARGAQERLAGDETRGLHHLNVAQRYRDKYQFTQEEIDGSST